MIIDTKINLTREGEKETWHDSVLSAWLGMSHRTGVIPFVPKNKPMNYILLFSSHS